MEVARRTHSDPRTLRTLFHAGCDELRQVSFAEALRLLLSHLEQGLKAFAELTTVSLRGMLEDFMAQIPALLRRATLLLTHFC